ncbi:MAG: GGDEF domain-containing protein [Sideroxydans sp.]|jgi:diguanylate cyclase (GGDEF)-like protein|nr:GGDEF domain-containing protein [Sideroxydans sp.]
MEQHSSIRNSAVYDFDPVRAQQVMAALCLNANENMTQQLRSGLSGEQAEKIVETSLAKLAHHPDFPSVGEGDLVAFRQGWLDYLQSFGLNFGTPAHFAERMAFSAACARAGIPLGLLHLQHSLILQSVIELLAASKMPVQGLQSPAVHVLKLGALDAYLATEGYREARIDALQKALAESNEEVSRLHHMASTDQLTGLTNFNSLMEKLELQVAKAKERKHPLCVMMADLDFFKKVNDTYGHMVGDMVLRHTAKRIKAAVRDFDIVGRFGGEEFTIVLKNTDIDMAKVIAERIRNEISATPMHVKETNIHITISLGGAMLKHEETREALLDRADAALYEAKRTGRNRVVFAMP